MEASRVDISRLRKRLGAANAARTNAASAAMQVMVQTLGENLAINSPRDTNRYVQAWMQAASQAGAKGLPTFPLQKSRFYDQQERALRRQVEYWKRLAEDRRLWLVTWRLNEGRDPQKDAWGRRIAAEFNRYEKRAEEAQRQVNEFLAAKNPVIVIGRTLGTKGVRGKPVMGGRALITIRQEVYGGEGAVVIRRDRIDAYLRNKEPHARIVEAKTQTFAKSFEVARFFGVRKASREFVKKVSAAFANPNGPEKKYPF